MEFLEYVRSGYFWLVILILLLAASAAANIWLFRKCRRLEDEKRTLEYELAGTYVDDFIGFDE